MSNADKKNILILISGSIAAYKTCFLISQLVQLGHQLEVVVTPQALRFIGPSTIEGLTGKPVHHDIFATQHSMDHIHLIRWADLVLLCPATANTINKMASGIGDDLVTTLFLAHDFKKPFLVAPAMNSVMYQNPITQASIQKLKSLNLKILSTGTGTLACGEVGYGRLLEPEELLEIIKSELLLIPKKANRPVESIQKPKIKILITSGGTQEPIDAMRVISNLSTGATGAFLAEVFFEHGYEVHYLSGATAIKPHRPCEQASFTSFNDLNKQLQAHLQAQQYSCVIHAAAVSDFSITQIKSGTREITATHEKISSANKLTIELEPNFKILPLIKSYSSNPPPFVIGFKLTSTSNEGAKKQSVDKLFSGGGVDLVVHNDSADIDKIKNLHSFTLYTPQYKKPIPNKLQLAEALIEWLELKLKDGETTL